MIKPLSHLRRNAVAYVALFAAVGTGGAYAAEKLGSKDIAKNAIRSKHVKDGSLQPSDLAFNVAGGAAGAAGPAGPQGPQGEKGEPGEPGISVYDAPIPSGTTVTGAFGFQQPLVSGKKVTFTTSLPAPAPVELDSDHVNFAAGASAAIDGDTSCTGSFGQPTAPPGKVCLYNNGSSGVSAAEGRAQTGSHGFQITLTSSGGNDDFVGTFGSWAYTAP